MILVLNILAAALAQSPLRLLDVVCHYSCLTCEGTTEYDCIDCTTGHRLYGFGACPCEPGYYEQSEICECKQTLVIIECASSCSTCIEAAKCLTCTPPLVLSGSICSCPTRTYLNSGRCSRCHASCYSCSGRLNSECVTCADNRKLLGQQCPCTEGYFDQAGCKACLAYCKTCTIGTECETCHDDRELDTNRQCGCKTHYFETQASTCGVCHESCLTCKDESEFGCLKCAEGQVIDTFGRCVCPLGQYADAEGCLTCDPSCLSCVGSGPANCTDCSTISHRTTPNLDGSCTCNDGFYQDGYLGLCIRCHAHCLTCRGPYQNHCVTCPATQALEASICVCAEFRQGVDCVAQCGQGYYQIGKECLPCHQFCDSCTSPHLSECVCSAVQQAGQILTDIELQHDGYRGYVLYSVSLDARIRQFTCEEGKLKPFAFDESKYDYSWSYQTADGVEIDRSQYLLVESKLQFIATTSFTPTQYRVVYTLLEKTGSSVSSTSIEFQSYIPFIAAFISGGDRQLSTQTTHSITVELYDVTGGQLLQDLNDYSISWTCQDCLTTFGTVLLTTADSPTLEILAGSFTAGQQITVQASLKCNLDGAKAATASAALTFVSELLPEAILSMSFNNFGRYVNIHENVLASVLAPNTIKPQMRFRMRSGGTTYSPPVSMSDWVASFRLQDHITEFAQTVEFEFSFSNPGYFAAATFKRQIKVNPPLADCRLLVTGGPIFKIQVDGCSVGSIPLVYQFYYYVSDADRAKDYAKGLLVEAIPLTNPQYASHTETMLVAGNGVVLARIQDYLGGYTNLTEAVTVQQEVINESLLAVSCSHCAAELIVSSSTFQTSKSYDALAATLWTTYNNTYDRARVRISTKLMQRQIQQQTFTNASSSMDVFANQTAEVSRELQNTHWFRPYFLSHVMQDDLDSLLSHLHCLYRLLDVYNQGLIPLNNFDAFMISHIALQQLSAVSLSGADRNDAAFTDTLKTVTYFNQKVDRNGLNTLLGVDAIEDPVAPNVNTFVLLRTDYTHNYFGKAEGFVNNYIILPSSTATVIDVILLYDGELVVDLNNMLWRQPNYKQNIPYHLTFDPTECPYTSYVCISRQTLLDSPWISQECASFQELGSGEGVCKCTYTKAVTVACLNQTQQASQDLNDNNEEEEEEATDEQIVAASAKTQAPASSITWSKVPLIYISCILIAQFVAVGAWGAYKDHLVSSTVVPDQPLTPYQHIVSQQLSPQNRFDKRSKEQSISVFPPQQHRFQTNNLPQQDGNNQHDTIQQNISSTQQLADTITNQKPTIKFITYLVRQHPLSLSYNPNYTRLFRSLMNLHTLFLDLASALYFGKDLEVGSFFIVIVLSTLCATTQRLILVKMLTHSNSIVKALGGIAFIGLAQFALYVIVYSISVATQQEQPNSWSIQFCISYLIDNALFQVAFAFGKYRSARIRNLFQ